MMNKKKTPQYPKIYPEIRDRLEKVVRELYSINYHGHDGKMIKALLILEDILNQDKKDYPNYPDCIHCPTGHYCDGPVGKECCIDYWDRQPDADEKESTHDF